MRTPWNGLARPGRVPGRRFLIAAVLGAAGLAANGVRAEEPLRLADVVAAALDANPSIAVARQRAQAMREVPAQVSAYDDPTLSWEGWDIPESLRVDQAENNIFRLSQKVPYPGKRTLAGMAATREADAASEDVRTSQLDVRAAVTRAYADLWLAHERTRIIGRDRALIERSAKTAESQYAVGQSTQADVLRAQVELTHATIQERTAGLAIDRARAALNALLSRAPSQPLGVPEPPAVRHIDASVDTLVERALQQRPELAAQRSTIGRETSGVELARLGTRPDFEVSVGRFLNYGRSDGFGAMASVTLPFVQELISGKYGAAVGEARARVAGAESEMRRLRDAVQREVAEAYAMANSAALEHDLARSTHVPHAEQAVRVTEAAYVSGEVDFAALLDTLRMMQATHLQHIEAAAAYERAVADLERAVGGPLDGATP